MCNICSNAVWVYGLITDALASGRSALQLTASGLLVEASITPADVLAIGCPQLGPTLAAVNKLIVMIGRLHLTVGKGRYDKNRIDVHFFLCEYCLYLHKAAILPCNSIHAKREGMSSLCCGCDFYSPSGPEAAPWTQLTPAVRMWKMDLCEQELPLLLCALQQCSCSVHAT